jgi:hypothetical protein
MQQSYIRYGRRQSIPSTAQILDELKAGFVEGYVPISHGYAAASRRQEPEGEPDAGSPILR